jgi:hypothetical protein
VNDNNRPLRYAVIPGTSNSLWGSSLQFLFHREHVKEKKKEGKKERKKGKVPKCWSRHVTNKTAPPTSKAAQNTSIQYARDGEGR